MFDNIITLLPEIYESIGQTALMVSISLLAAVAIGTPLGVYVFLTEQGSIQQNTTVNRVLNTLINVIRSFPFIILLVVLIPVTRLLIGETVGPLAASVPLSIAAIPYFARLVEQALKEVPKGTIEAAIAIALIKQAKLGALRLPEALGGRGISNEQLFDVVRRLATADPDVAHALRSHFIFVEDNLAAPESNERTRRLDIIATGALVGNATTEISSKPQGSKQYDTTLLPTAEGYVLNGKKFFTTGTLYADYVSVLASGNDNDVFVCFIPTNRPGIEVFDDWDGFGQQLTASGTTTFHEVTVQRHEVVQIDRAKQQYVPNRQLFLQAVSVGIIDRIVIDAVDMLKGRKRTFTHGAAETATEDPLLLQTIGELQATAFTVNQTLRQAAKALDVAIAHRGTPQFEQYQYEAALQAAYVKIMNETLGLAAATKLLDVGGASATRRTLHLDRHWRNLRTIASHNPASFKNKDIGNYLVNGERLPVNGYY